VGGLDNHGEPADISRSYRCGRSWISCNERGRYATRHIRVSLL
jgi:hypothetical protein